MSGYNCNSCSNGTSGSNIELKWHQTSLGLVGWSPPIYATIFLLPQHREHSHLLRNNHAKWSYEHG
jgi:hypothetical protein